MVKTIAQIKREIASQRKRISKETSLSKKIDEKQKLSAELFKLKNRKLIGAGSKAKRLSKRFGKALLKVGQKAAPIVKKQARLIRDQQLRDDAIARHRLKVKTKQPKKSKRKTSKGQDLGIFSSLDF